MLVRFADAVRNAMANRGLSMRATAKEAHFDVAYLSRVLNGRQDPSATLALALDSVLGTDGALASLLEQESEERASDAAEHIRTSLAPLLHHDREFGADHVVDAAVQVWKSAVRDMPMDDRSYVAATAEAAEVAGWLLHEACRPDAARAALLEALMLAQTARDQGMEHFCLDLLAMAAVTAERPGEAMALADRLLTVPRVPHRVALMARVRQARALAITGDLTRASAVMERANGALQDSGSDRDPMWTWWIDEAEIAVHQGMLLVDAGDAPAALPHLQSGLDRSLHSSPRNSRRKSYASVLAEAAALAGAWRDTESIIVDHLGPLPYVTTTRTQLRIRRMLRVIDRDGPSWLKDTAHSLLPQ
ncbi:helix-turn-helix domain-containing protein [Streptomyces clavuligerus]|uniref:Helix-turn-helix protein n=1 Tax=Streptomyces clavuligerus TaxID=1901 RepID=E2Q6W1_STRCL|nr:helix-turn-helix transcriptional regulator [Streptomyces clavuligerus]ANW21839.1 DNA-binding protein [Streptomyces clavuligerus]EFG09410.1 Helix-turn-helix protein [Streptomyces clavuligerus]WDN55608.1 helix-turn-helix transcriptional regulator [Streptomyces clavuligerus]